MSAQAGDDRIGALLDKQDIQEALMRYSRGIDRADVAVLASAFHPDARVEMGPTVFESGPEAASRLIELAASARSSSHFLGNILIRLDGDSAFSETYFVASVAIDQDGQTSLRARGGRYLDRLERRAGQWRIADRTVVEDWARTDVLPDGPPTPLRTGRRGTEDPLYALIPTLSAVQPEG